MRHRRQHAARRRHRSGGANRLGLGLELLAEGGGEGPAPLEPVLGVFGERREEHVVEVCQLRAVVAEPGRLLVQVLADHRDRVGVLERRRTGEQMKGRGGQGILISPAIDVGTRQLLGCGVGHRTDRDVGLGDAADVGQVARNAEVRQ